jgi:hypothetical protein
VFAWNDVNNDGVVDGTNIEENNLLVTTTNVAITNRCRDDAGCDVVTNTFTIAVSSLSVFALIGPLDTDGDGVPDDFDGVVDECVTTPGSAALNGCPDIEAPVTTNTTAVPNPVAVGSNVDLTANVDDTNTGGSNIASAEYSLDGGSTWSPMSATDGTFDEVSEDVEASFNAPAEAGIYDFCVRGTDDPGNVGDPECIMLVVYDPTGGFVTGGGWIDSPAGAYIADPSLTGKANFGFVSKYKKGATVPTGNTEFRFKAGDLNFHSSSYDFLVITMGGTNAMYSGS